VRLHPGWTRRPWRPIARKSSGGSNKNPFSSARWENSWFRLLCIRRRDRHWMGDAVRHKGALRQAAIGLGNPPASSPNLIRILQVSSANELGWRSPSQVSGAINAERHHPSIPPSEPIPSPVTGLEQPILVGVYPWFHHDDDRLHHSVIPRNDLQLSSNPTWFAVSLLSVSLNISYAFDHRTAFHFSSAFEIHRCLVTSSPGRGSTAEQYCHQSSAS